MTTVPGNAVAAKQVDVNGIPLDVVLASLVAGGAGGGGVGITEGIPVTANPYLTHADNSVDGDASNAGRINSAIAGAVALGIPAVVPAGAKIGLGAKVVLPAGVILRGVPGSLLTRDFTGGPLIGNDTSQAAIAAYIENVATTVRGVGNGTGSHWTLKLAGAKMRNCGVTAAYAVGLGFTLECYDTDLDGLYAFLPTTLTGTGAFRFVGGSNVTAYRFKGQCGDDWCQVVPGANPVDTATQFNLNCDHILFVDCKDGIGGRICTQSIDVANDCNIYACGWRGVSGAGRFYGMLIETRSHYTYEAATQSHRDGTTCRYILAALSPRNFQQFSTGQLVAYASGDATWDRAAFTPDSRGKTVVAGLNFVDLGDGTGQIIRNTGDFSATVNGDTYQTGDGVFVYTTGGLASPNKGYIGKVLGTGTTGGHSYLHVSPAPTTEDSTFNTGLRCSNAVTYRIADTHTAGDAPAGLRLKRAVPGTVTDAIVENVELNDANGSWVSCILIRGLGVTVRRKGLITVKNVRKSALRAYGQCSFPDLTVVSPDLPSDGSLPLFLIKDVINSRLTVDCVAPTASTTVQFNTFSYAPGDSPDGTVDEGLDTLTAAYASNFTLSGVIRGIRAGVFAVENVLGGLATRPVVISGLKMVGAPGEIAKGIHCHTGTWTVIEDCDFTELGADTFAKQIQIDSGAHVTIGENNRGLLGDSTIVAALKAAASTPSITDLGTQRDTTSTSLVDVTGLSIAVTAGQEYEIRARLRWQSSATTTGVGFGLQGPSKDYVVYRVQDALVAAGTPHFVHARDWGISGVSTSNDAANADCLSSIEGVVKPNASGVIQVQFRSEDGGTVSVMPGSFIEVVPKG